MPLKQSFLGILITVLVAFGGSNAFAEGSRAQVLIDGGLEAYASMGSYDTRLHRELLLSNGRLKIDEMFLRFEQPHTVLLAYTDGGTAGLQVLYSEGNFDGKLMTRPPGLLFNWIPIVAMSPDDPRVQSEESRPIQNAGIGHMIQKFATDWAEAESTGEGEVVLVMDDQVIVASKYAKEPIPTKRLEVLIKQAGRQHPRIVMHFNQSDGLPVQMELFEADSLIPAEVYTYYQVIPNPEKKDPRFTSVVDSRLIAHYAKI